MAGAGDETMHPPQTRSGDCPAWDAEDEEDAKVWFGRRSHEFVKGEKKNRGS